MAFTRFGSQEERFGSKEWTVLFKFFVEGSENSQLPRKKWFRFVLYQHVTFCWTLQVRLLWNYVTRQTHDFLLYISPSYSRCINLDSHIEIFICISTLIWQKVLSPNPCLKANKLTLFCCQCKKTPTKGQSSRLQAVWNMPEWLLMFLGPFPGTHCLDLTNFGRRYLGLKAEDSRLSSQCRQKKCRGARVKGPYPG